MAANLLFLRLMSVLLVVVSADPAPGRVPKVYNALITSNQNLEPSKSYPVYQPVLHDPFGVSLHPSVLYGGDFAFRNDLNPAAPSPPAEPSPPTASSGKAPEAAPTAAPATDAPPAENPPTPDAESRAPAAPPTPDTKPGIPQNDYWLPPQLLPLGPISPAYSGFPQLGPYPFYPGVRLYDPFNSGPYGFPFYRPLPNVVGLGPSYGQSGAPLVPVQAPAPPAPAGPQNPPAEPSDLNVLNYWSKDPAIPNVPPPPLPQGGLKPDTSE